MCGIAGIINFRRRFSGDELSTFAEQMAGTMFHRGPDDGGVWVAPQNECAFSQRRLSIIDLSPAGHQPMKSADGLAWITFNGEIYNYQEVRRELEAKGIQFRTKTDTEVLLEAVRHYGTSVFSKLDGMYAFAVYDTTTKETIIGRDPFGEKPLYYVENSTYLAFASELHGLTKLPGFDTSIDESAVGDLLALQYVHAPRTIYRSAKKLPPGHFLKVSAQGKVTMGRHFEFSPSAGPYESRSLSDLADELKEILVTSIRRRMISDVPLGAFLSGGVDSSLVVALMRKELGAEVHTYSMGFEGTEDSEHLFARGSL